MQTPTDEALVEAYCQKDERRALGLLYQRYGHLVVGLCLDYLKDREAAKDATMEVFEKVTLKVCRQPIDSFRAWLFYTSRNHCIDRLRKTVRERERAEAISQTTFMESATTERPLSEERLDHLPTALAELSPDQQQCVRLFYLRGQSYAQVSEQTGFDLKQVKSYLQNGRRNLRIHLQKLSS